MRERERLEEKMRDGEAYLLIDTAACLPHGKATCASAEIGTGLARSVSAAAIDCDASATEGATGAGDCAVEDEADWMRSLH